MTQERIGIAEFIDERMTPENIIYVVGELTQVLAALLTIAPPRFRVHTAKLGCEVIMQMVEKSME